MQYVHDEAAAAVDGPRSSCTYCCPAEGLGNRNITYEHHKVDRIVFASLHPALVHINTIAKWWRCSTAAFVRRAGIHPARLKVTVSYALARKVSFVSQNQTGRIRSTTLRARFNEKINKSNSTTAGRTITLLIPLLRAQVQPSSKW